MTRRRGRRVPVGVGEALAGLYRSTITTTTWTVLSTQCRNGADREPAVSNIYIYISACARPTTACRTRSVILVRSQSCPTRTCRVFRIKTAVDTYLLIYCRLLFDCTPWCGAALRAACSRCMINRWFDFFIWHVASHSGGDVTFRGRRQDDEKISRQEIRFSPLKCHHSLPQDSSRTPSLRHFPMRLTCTWRLDSCDYIEFHEPLTLRASIWK